MYLPERDLLILLLSKEYYNTYFEYIDMGYMKDNFKELYYVYVILQSLHEEYPTHDLQIEEVQAAFFMRYPDVDKEIYVNLFKTISETKLQSEIGVGILQQIKRRKTALALSEQSFKYSSGNASLESVIELVKSLDTVEELDAGPPSEDIDLEILLNSAVREPGLRWRLDCLNKSLGSLRPGDFGFLFKRPETGGTAFCASEVGYMIDQTDKPIIWFNNEEQNNKVILRIYQAYFGVTLTQLLSDTGKYQRIFKERCGDRLKFYGIDFCNKTDVAHIVKSHQPALVVYDQLDKIVGFDADRDDLRLGAIYQWARELAKYGHAAIGVTQADGSADNTKWLTMGNVANAKTSKQAEADWILGMGAVQGEGTEFIRYLSICKNKLLGDQDSLPHLRHGRFEVLIESEKMQFKDIINYA